MKLTKVERSKKVLNIQELDSLSYGSYIEGTILNGKERRMYIKTMSNPYCWTDIKSGNIYKSCDLVGYNDVGSIIEVNLKEIVYEDK